jgi:GTP-binding protein
MPAKSKKKGKSRRDPRSGLRSERDSRIEAKAKVLSKPRPEGDPQSGLRSEPRIVLVGPTNVGKSTLFNRLTRTRKAIVADRPGVTVDRHELRIEESHIGPCTIIDTGGVGPEALSHPLGAEIQRAASEAVTGASIILFVVDGTHELGVEELEVAAWLRRQKGIENEKVWVVANKSDVRKFDPESYHALGFEKLVPLSAENNLGLSDLWELLSEELGSGPDEVVVSDDEAADEAVQDENYESEGRIYGRREARPPRILVLGRPNVGKSTLLNAILGYERHVVSEVAGTTRDPIETRYTHKGIEWSLLDTAGMRRPGRLERGVEWVAREKLKEEAREADLAVLVCDATEGVSDLDAAIAGMALDFGLSLVLVLNKFDKMTGEDQDDKLHKLARTKDLKMDFMQWCPVVKMSALTGKGVSPLLKQIERIVEARTQRVQTARLNSLFEIRFKDHPHPAAGGRRPKFYYLSQVKANPPEFVLFSNVQAKQVHFSFKRFIVNTLRTEFGFEGTPVKLHFKTARAR